MHFDIEEFNPSISKDLLRQQSIIEKILLISAMAKQRPLCTLENLFFSVVQMCGQKKMVTKTLTSLWEALGWKLARQSVYIFYINQMRNMEKKESAYKEMTVQLAFRIPAAQKKKESGNNVLNYLRMNSALTLSVRQILKLTIFQI